MTRVCPGEGRTTFMQRRPSLPCLRLLPAMRVRDASTACSQIIPSPPEFAGESAESAHGDSLPNPNRVQRFATDRFTLQPKYRG
jgi:hypothetical protein